MLSWEASAYFKDSPRKASWWDRLSTVFRGNAMYVRMQSALDLLGPHLADRTVMDVGCGSGRFAFQMSESGTAKVIGVDIAAEAIALANERRLALGLGEKLEFHVEDLIYPKAALPAVDIVTALGVIEYFDPTTMTTFLGNLKTKYFLFDFPDLNRRKEFPTWMLRQVYIRVNRLPGVFLYSLEQFARIAEPFGFKDIHMIKRDKFYYVTNLPRD